MRMGDNMCFLVGLFKLTSLILLVQQLPMALSTIDLSVRIKSITRPIQHAEGPVWDAKSQSLLFVDTFQATAYRLGFWANRLNSHKFDNQNIGVIIPIKGATDNFVVGAGRDLYTFLWPAENSLATLSEKKVSRVDENKPKNQFNDGKADSQGRLWIGTLTRNDDLSVTSKGGSLFMIDKLTNIVEKISQTSISNGLDWSKEDDKLYFIDSETRTVAIYDYNSKTGQIDNMKILFDLQDHPKYKGIPDGMTVDGKGNLWVALFGGKTILNIDPSGKLLREIEMPVTYVTSVCFGGPNFETLFATTSRLHLNDAQLLDEPLAGSVFAIENLGVSGRPVNEIVL